MNIEKFTAAIQPTLEWLRNGGDVEYQFDMKEWRCGSVCCIGGHIHNVYGGIVDFEEFMGLTESEEGELFFIESYTVPLCKVTPAMAVKVIEHAIETGTIDWSVAL